MAELTGEGMNKLKYDFVLRGYPVWNLRMAHVDTMCWSILARLGKTDVLLIVLSK